MVTIYKAVKMRTKGGRWRIVSVEVEEKEKTYAMPGSGDAGGDFNFSRIFYKKDEGRLFFRDKLEAVNYAIQTKLDTRRIFKHKLEESQLDLLRLKRLQRKIETGGRRR